MIRKRLSILLALTLTFSALNPGTVQAEAPEKTEPAQPAEEAAALPEIGDVIYGFEAKEIRPFSAIGAQVVYFEHQKTKAKLTYIANDDTNRAFDLSFMTDAVDKTGLPHVFEHSVLDGCEKYPSRTLWFNAVYQTYNTYMNAYTQSRLTGYPVASLSEAQLLKYADYYTASCLHPLVVEDESIFREEAWRYRLEDADAPLTIEGTVYSEMLGATDLNGAAFFNALETAFPGSTIGNSYGGDPAYIPDMTFEALRSYHSRYYHPSNCMAYLYGSFEDYTAFLKLLDEAFEPYEYREFVHEDPGYTPFTGQTEASYAFPVEAFSDTENASTIYYAFVCPGAEHEQELILNTLTDLLTDNASEMQQSLQAALPSGTFGSYICTDSPEDAIVIIADNVNPEDASLFKETVDAALEKIAEEGFPQDQVDGIMTTLRIQMLLMREDANVGVGGLIPGLAMSYATSGNPFEYIEYVESLEQMDEWNKQGLYQQAVSDWLLNAEAAALVTTYPEAGAKEEADAALAQKLADVKASMSEEELGEIIEQTNAEEPQEDNSAALKEMQAVTVESLPEEINTYDVSDETGDDGIRRIDVTAQVDDIGEVNVFLDAAGVKQEDLHWLSLYADLAGKLDTRSHTKAEIASLMSRYLNSGDIYVSIVGHGDDYHPYLRAVWIGLDEDLKEGYDLVKELFYEEKFDDPSKIREAVSGLRTDLKESVNREPYSIQVMRGGAVYSGLARYYTYTKQLEYYSFLTEVDQMLESDPASVTEHLESIAQQMNNRTNAVSVFCGNEESISINRPLADEFLSSLEEEPVYEQVYDLPVPASSEALIVDGGVQYNGEIADFETLGLDGYEGGLDAVTSLVTDSFLYPLLRDQYGAYGAIHQAKEFEGVYMFSFRDPNIDKTFDVYNGLPRRIDDYRGDQDTVNGYILSSYAKFAKSEGELSGAVSAAVDTLSGDPLDRKLTYMQDLKKVTPKTIAKYRDMYAKLNKEGVKFTAGPASAINAEADRYEAILNPFGTVDFASQEFEDVGEEDEFYDAVMGAVGAGLMAPVSETRFGAEDPATEGDIATALFVLMGGSADLDAAIAAFAEFGLFIVEPEDTVTGMELDGFFQWVAGEAWTGEGGNEPLTRAELAVQLMAFSDILQSIGDDAA